MFSSTLFRYSSAAASVLCWAGSCHLASGLDGVAEVVEVAPRAQGEPCEEATQCEGGVCLDGRCCERACNTACETCNGAVPGICSPLPVFEQSAECIGGAPLNVTLYAGLGNQAVARIAYDSVGNRLVSGHFQGTIEFDGEEATAAEEAVFFAKYAPDGSLMWRTLFQTDLTSGIENQLIGFDGDDHVVVAGTYGPNITLGVQSFALPDSDRNIFVAKLDANSGEVLAATSLASTGGQYAVELDVKPAGDVLLLAGFYGGSWSVDGEQWFPTPNNAVDIAFIGFTPELTPTPLQAIGGNANDLPRAMVIDEAGDAFVAASIQGSVTLVPNEQFNADGRDAVLFKRNPDGDIHCSLGIDSVDAVSLDEPFKLRLDSQGDVWMLGRSDSALTFANTVLEHGGGSDVWLAKVNSDCLLVTVLNITTGSGDEVAYDFAIDADDNFVVTFDLGGTATDLGGGPLPAYGRQDSIIAKFASDGTHLWSAAYGDENNQLFGDVVVDPAGLIQVTGRFQGSFMLGSYALNGNETSADEGMFDAFVATIQP